MKASEDPLLHSYGNWLACIAGSMASLAFVVAWLLGKCWKFRDVAFAMKCLQGSYPNHIGMKMHSHPDLGFQGMCFGKPGCWLFKVEESAIDDTIVKEHCDQILDQPLDMLGLFGRYCCVAWQIDILIHYYKWYSNNENTEYYDILYGHDTDSESFFNAQITYTLHDVFLGYTYQWRVLFVSFGGEMLRRGRDLCVKIGLSRHLRSIKEMNIWPIEILEQDKLHP